MKNVGKTILPTATSAPATGVEGQVYWDLTLHALYTYNGTAWVAAVGASGGSNKYSFLMGE